MNLKEYRVELIVLAALMLVYATFSVLHSEPKLTQAEVDDYVRTLEQNLPKNLEDRSQLIERLRAWGESDDGKPVFMLNLMRLYPEVKPVPGGPTGMTTEEANIYYEGVTAPMLFKLGGYPMVIGNITGISDGPESNLMVYSDELDNWDRVAIVRYPGRRAFLDLMSDPEYIKVMPYKTAALKVVLTPVNGEMVLSDLRWPLLGLLGCIFLLVCWVCERKRRRV